MQLWIFFLMTQNSACSVFSRLARYSKAELKNTGVKVPTNNYKQLDKKLPFSYPP